MPTNLPNRNSNGKPNPFLVSTSDLGFVAASLSVPSLIMVLMAIVPPPLVLPVFGIMAFLFGSIMGLWATRSQHDVGKVRQRKWDVAGTLVLIGCAALVMTDLSYALTGLDDLLQAGFANDRQAN